MLEKENTVQDQEVKEENIKPDLNIVDNEMSAEEKAAMDEKASQLMAVTEDQIRMDARKYLDHTVSENTQSITFGVIIQILIEAGLTTRDDLNKRVANCQVELLTAIEGNVTKQKEEFSKNGNMTDESMKNIQLKYFDFILEEIPAMKKIVTEAATQITGPSALDVDQTKDIETKECE